MKIVFNKWGGVGMEATRPEPAPLPFLIALHICNAAMDSLFDLHHNKATTKEI